MGKNDERFEDAISDVREFVQGMHHYDFCTTRKKLIELCDFSEDEELIESIREEYMNAET